MLKIKTEWSRKVTATKNEIFPTDQHFLDVPHYREYQKTMKRRGWDGKLISVTDTVTGKDAEVQDDKIIFHQN
jgi:hypothetical protein